MPKFFFAVILNLMLASITCLGQEGIERINTLDSLFLKKEYKQIIDICNQPDNSSSSACSYNLIGAHYFSGDSLEAWNLLDKEIAKHKAYPDADAYSLGNLLAEDYTGYWKFLRESTAKDYIFSLIDSLYGVETVLKKRDGLELLHLLIEDQWVRNTSSLYYKYKPERKFLLPSDMDSIQAIGAQDDHRAKVFNFYKSKKKIFSEMEVGRAYYSQMMLLFHETDLKRREYYHELLLDAVKNGAFEMKDRANFEAGTEYWTLGVDEFFKQRAELEANYKKKYSLPDDYRIRLF